MEIIRISLPRKVVIDVGDVRPFANIRQVGQAVLVDGDLCQHASIAFERGLTKSLWQIAPLCTHPHRERIHARALSFEPITGDRSLIDDLPPKSGFLVLISFESRCELTKYLDQLTAVRLIFRN